MTHDHIGIMLHALLAVPLPAGYRSSYRERYDTVIEQTFRDVVIHPDDLDVPTFTFGTPGAYAQLAVNPSGDTYTVGIFATHVAYHVQSAGHVVAFTTARDAVECAIFQISGHLEGRKYGR